MVHYFGENCLLWPSSRSWVTDAVPCLPLHPFLLRRSLLIQRFIASHGSCFQSASRGFHSHQTDSGSRPEHLEVLNESHMHAVPPGSESHFRVLVVSSRFEGLSLLQRHRLVNETLSHELSTSVHALAIQAKTPEQWSSNPSVAKSPPCLGGSKHDSTVAEKLKSGLD
ncbi:hypothetical protein PHYPO_G00125090 [Pangasianodon hypophthalmus]|uniref:BolA-like protein 1 n=1 Tax=Pangasianodon hypophthalmus TaxID=310915 RepID=A0A5N5KR67_PANHP|nr:hypothetical protein PHYPO_G00125090 [Pangasianodon hypophthalmus]